MRRHKSCDPNLRDCVELREALTRIFQSKTAFKFTNLHCVFDMPEGWFPDYLDATTTSLKAGWRTHRDVAAIRIQDRGVLVIAETRNDANALAELEMHFDTLMEWVQPRLTQSGRVVTLPFIANLGAQQPGDGILYSRFGYDGLESAIASAVLDFLPESADPSVTDAVEDALYRSPCVTGTSDLEELVDEFAELDMFFESHAG